MNADLYHLHSLHYRSKMATSCKNLVKFCPVTPEIMELICAPRYLYLAKIVMLEHWNADGRINCGKDQATPGINLVGFLEDQYIQS